MSYLLLKETLTSNKLQIDVALTAQHRHEHTLFMIGFSSSISMAREVEWTQVLVHRCLSRTYDDLGTRLSFRVIVVGSSSNMDAIS